MTDREAGVPAREAEPAAAEAPATEAQPVPQEEAERGTGPVGTGKYIVKDGDCMDSISLHHGFFWETLWNDGGNSEIREVRQDPFVLLSGDRVHIPEKRRKEDPGATERRHRFRRKGMPAHFELTLYENGSPRKNTPYTLIIANAANREGVTDENGTLREAIPPDAREGRLLIGEKREELKVSFGRVDPITELSGVKFRLKNMGFFHGAINNELTPETTAAIAEFQRAENLPGEGKLDDATRAAIREAHGN